jgi:chromosome segregation ATPase
MPARKTSTAESTLPAGQQTIEQLQERYQELNNKKVAATTLLTQARQQLEKLQREAQEKYGTNDIAALRAKLQEMKDENERKRAEYQADLERIERELTEVEENFEATVAAGGKETP